MPKPLNIPQRNPTTRGTKITTYQGIPALATTAKIINDNIIIEPTERSIPAVTMTIKTPKANIDCQEICLKIFVIVLHERKTSGCIRCKARTIKNNKIKIPYLSKYGIVFKKILSFFLFKSIYFLPIIQPITSSRLVSESLDSAKFVP